VDCVETAWGFGLLFGWSVFLGRRGEDELVKRISAHVWMPRHRPAKKDVASCEKLRGVASER
jgi:hypothetical protein